MDQTVRDKIIAILTENGYSVPNESKPLMFLNCTKKAVIDGDKNFLIETLTICATKKSELVIKE